MRWVIIILCVLIYLSGLFVLTIKKGHSVLNGLICEKEDCVSDNYFEPCYDHKYHKKIGKLGEFRRLRQIEVASCLGSQLGWPFVYLFRLVAIYPLKLLSAAIGDMKPEPPVPTLEELKRLQAEIGASTTMFDETRIK